MKMVLPLVLGMLALAPAAAAAADAGDSRRADQAAVFEARRAGRILPVDLLVRKVAAQLPGWTYTGFDFDADSDGVAIYKLIFMRDGNVTWIYVDGRTGNTLGRK